MKQKTLIVFFLLFTSMIFSETVIISTVEGLPLSDICSKILESVYERAGYDLEIIPMPPERASLEASTGRVYGETHRVGAYGESHSDLIRITIPIYSVRVELYTTNGNSAQNSTIEDLNKYRFTILRGVKNSKTLTSEFSNVQVVDEPDVMFQLLKMGRTDFAVTSNIFGEIFLKRSGMECIVTYKVPLETTFLYHYLHKDHSDLALVIEETLYDMSESGELDLIKKAAEDSVLLSGK